jgi:phage-related protein
MVEPVAVEVVFYQEADGECPVLDFLDARPNKVRQIAAARIALLEEHGHGLRRPYCENLGRGLYELRWRVGRVQYRILYFFHGRAVVVLAHALAKEAQIPAADLGRALRRKQLFAASPRKHTRPGEPT